ncbi:MAG: Asp-tRNA(Asn)/Glu-tRNA(Gln) amidotransferase subunit GatC [Candidatus Odinarchaeia archaeon]
MSKILSEEEVKHISWLSKIKLTEEQIKLFTKQFNDILNYFKKLDQADTSNVKLELYVTPLVDVFREDIVKPSLSLEQALKNAPKTEKTFIKAPKII